MKEYPKLPLAISKAMTEAIAAGMTIDFNRLWREYNESGFRRQWLGDWAGDDPEKQAVVKELLEKHPIDAA